MRRFLVCAVVTALVFGCFASVAQAGKGRGAVKTDLIERTADGDVAGWVVLNTNAKGILIVRAKLADNMPDTDFTIWVVVDGLWLEADLGTLSTNRRGKGLGRLKLDLADYLPADYAEDNVQVRVVVDNWYPGVPTPPYVGYATSEEDVPLKKRRGKK